MKKTSVLLFIFLLISILASGEKAGATITEEEMQGNPQDNPDHFVWDLMAQLQTPDDPDCTAIAEAALLAGGVPAEQVAGPRDGSCSGLASMRTNMESGMNEGGGQTETNLFDAPDWHSVENLYFQHSVDGIPEGRITFTNPIDFMSYNFMTFMSNFGNAMDVGDGLIGLDADIVNGMAGYGAMLTMYNVDDFENPKILVNGEEDTEGVVSGLVYDRAARTITFNAAHFSTFEVVEGSSDSETPKISRVKIQKYTSSGGKTRLKISLFGNHFNRDTEVTLGGKDPIRTSFKRTGKIVAFFNLDKIQKMGKAEMKLRAINGGENKKYKRLILLDDILKMKSGEIKSF